MENNMYDKARYSMENNNKHDRPKAKVCKENINMYYELRFLYGKHQQEW